MIKTIMFLVSLLAPSAAPLPWLCSLDGGRWCDQKCLNNPCPQADTGALCCYSGACFPWTGEHCSGVLGWCNHYTTTTDQATGIKTATCHD